MREGNVLGSSFAAVHTLTFLEPGHFHATLTLKAPHAAVSPEIFVYATAGPELDDFLALVEKLSRHTKSRAGVAPTGMLRTASKAKRR